MTERSTQHATFVIDRTFDAPPARVFKAFADPAAKKLWFGGPPEWEHLESSMDFRVGGREVDRGGPKGGWISRYDAVYQDIIPDERIIFSYDMHLDDVRISVSLTTIELKPEGTGTRMTFTEQGVYLDGYDDANKRETGTRDLLDQLAKSLA